MRRILVGAFNEPLAMADDRGLHDAGVDGLAERSVADDVSKDASLVVLRSS